MNVDRYMISLFFEIKRNLPYKQRAELKIADPTLYRQLHELYNASNDQVTRRLIEVFFERSKTLKETGKKLNKSNKSRAGTTNVKKRDTKNNETNAVDQPKTSPNRYYRGVLIQNN